MRLGFSAPTTWTAISDLIRVPLPSLSEERRRELTEGEGVAGRQRGQQ